MQTQLKDVEIERSPRRVANTDMTFQTTFINAVKNKLGIIVPLINIRSQLSIWSPARVPARVERRKKRLYISHC